jgi:hypothetical protein
MKVKDLIKALKKVDPNRIVVMSKDSEGNSHSPLAYIMTCAYSPDSTYSGQIGLEKLTPEDKKLGYTEEDLVKGNPAICLYPTN